MFLNEKNSMTKVAIIGTGPCGVSMLRALGPAEKKGEKIQIVLKIYIFTNENNNNELQIIFIINFEKICYI